MNLDDYIIALDIFKKKSYNFRSNINTIFNTFPFNETNLIKLNNPTSNHVKPIT